jgi:uncharacterized protein (TIGR02594 family)
MDIVKIKAELNALGFAELSTTGPEALTVGPKTIAAIKAFQKARGLAVDGIVGPATLAALFGTVTAKGLPDKFSWLYREPGPRTLTQALKYYGVMEHAGHGSNPTIEGWAKELGVSGWYTDDDIPWCGLFAGKVVKSAGYAPPRQLLAAKSFLTIGRPIDIKDAAFFDIMVYSRPGGNHVNFYIGENANAFLGYGGNQSNAVGFTGIVKARCIGVRRLDWIAENPQNIRKIILAGDFALSNNQA